MRWKRNPQTVVRKALKRDIASIWRFALSLSGKRDVADDLTQATCLRALERADQVTNVDGVRAWFLTICRSIWLNELRAQSVRRAMSLSTEGGLDLIDEKPTAETNFFATEVFTEVMRLPEAQRAAVVLVFVEGYSYREAAEILDVPIGTIMSRLSAARGKLKAKFGPDIASGGESR